MTGVTHPAVHEYEDACMRLTLELPDRIPGVNSHRSTAGVPILPHYDSADPRLGNYEVDTALIVIVNVAQSATLALVPIALYERGQILASVRPSGSLAQRLLGQVREVLVLRDGRWVCLGQRPLPSKRLPTLDFIDTIRPIVQ